MDYIFNQRYFNLRRPAKTLILELINAANFGIDFVESDFIWGTPATNQRSEINCNTELLLTGSPENNRTGVQPIWYNRIDLVEIFDGNGVTVLTPVGVSSLSDLIDEINDKYGIYLTADDYVDTDLTYSGSPTDPRTIEIVAKPGSYMFMGSAVVRLGDWSVDPRDVALEATSVYMISYSKARTEGIWMQKLNAAMAIVADGINLAPEYRLLPSLIADHAILSHQAQVFIGDLHYEYTNPITGDSATLDSNALVVLGSVLIDLSQAMLSSPLMADKPDASIYACKRGSSVDEFLLGIHCPSNTQKHFNVLVTIADGFVEVLGVIACATRQGHTNNINSLYTDVVPVHYSHGLAFGQPAYVNVVVSVGAVFLRILNQNLQLVDSFAPIAVDTVIVSMSLFCQQIKPEHFSFTSVEDVQGTVITLSVAMPYMLSTGLDDNAVDGVLPLRFNGQSVITPVQQQNGRQLDKKWLGVVVITESGVSLPAVFYSDTVSYTSIAMDDLQVAKTGSALMYRREGNAGYSGIRMRANPAYGHNYQSAYPAGFSNTGSIELRGMNQFVHDQAMTTVLDAVAEEVYYTDHLGVQRSAGFVWHVIGLAGNTRNDFDGTKAKALTYMVFDANRDTAICRQSDLSLISVGDEFSSESVLFDSDETFAWIVR